MPNITTISSFTEEPIYIPNAINESAGVDDNSGLERVITKSERKLLREVLGAEQYNTLQEELLKRPFVPTADTDAMQEYVDLVNGSGTWQGLAAMLENFIFCAWLKATEVRQTMISTGKGETQGFTVADNSSKYSEIWNDFVDEYEDLVKYISDSEFFEYEIPDEEPYERVNSLGL